MEGATFITHTRANWRILSDAAIVGGFLAAAKAAGAIKVVLIARAFGAADIVDAFLIAFLLPSFFADTIAGPLAAALIPSLVQVGERNGKAAARKLHASLTAGMLGVMCALALVLALAVPVIVPLLGSGFSAEKLQLTRGAFYWLLLLLPFGALGVSWRAALNAEERFAAPAMAVGATPLMLAVLLFFVGQGWGIHVLIVGTLSGGVLELLLLGTALRRAGLAVMPHWTGSDPAIRRVFRQHIPLIATAVLGQAGILVDQSVAASLGPGSVSTLNYGTRLAAVLAGIGVSALGTAALPHLSRMVAAAQWGEVNRTLRTYGALALLAGLLLSIILIGTSESLVRLLFSGGALTESSAQLIASVQRVSMLQLPLLALLGLLGRFVSSLHKNEVLALAAALGLAVNVAGDFLLPRFLGLPGIALAAVLAQFVTLVCVLVHVAGTARRQ